MEHGWVKEGRGKIPFQGDVAFLNALHIESYRGDGTVWEVRVLRAEQTKRMDAGEIRPTQ